MATEKYITKKAIDICKKNKWEYYKPTRTRWQSQDIFLIGDLLLWRPEGLVLIQLTTAHNLSARRKKIKKVFEKIAMTCPMEIWAYNSKKREFRVEFLGEKLKII